MIADDIRDMAKRLRELGYSDAADSTLEVVRLAASLAPVWKAVEWCDSGDWNEEDVADEVSKWRTENGKAKP
jgi:hypothetical protein